jgi:hypothetical protein
MPNSRNLTPAKKQVIVAYILELVTRGESPWLAAVANIANSLQNKRNLTPVSIN